MCVCVYVYVCVCVCARKYNVWRMEVEMIISIMFPV